MASSAHVHHETGTLPVYEHSRMLGAQFLASCLRQSHPSFSTVTAPPGNRKMKGTLLEMFGDEVRPHLVDGCIPEAEYPAVRNGIHTSHVSSFVNNRATNPIINQQPPPVSHSISRLPRQTQRVLSQLRSGYSNKLATYRHRVGQAASDLCPDCLEVPQDTSHLFSCRVHPTPLTPLDLWINPILSATFLSSTPTFSDLELIRPSLLPSVAPSPLLLLLVSFLPPLLLPNLLLFSLPYPSLLLSHLLLLLPLPSPLFPSLFSLPPLAPLLSLNFLSLLFSSLIDPFNRLAEIRWRRLHVAPVR